MQGWKFCQTVEKTVFFSVVKTVLAKIVFAGKNRFLPEYVFIKIKYINFCLYFTE